ncbi:excalibur calcium-binding domain-containing protein [Brevundimonas sp. UBA7506]|uniref:excalibur calcium-binding domain-containing protein n=1 Tax=Brevundimonas sp. UBA7506 TaxID=1946136 RepID=UPI0039C8ABB0
MSRIRRRLSVEALLGGVLCIGLFGAVVLWPDKPSYERPFSTIENVRHVLAKPNCSATRLVRLAPARRGEPGYHLEHDRDRDGWACEPVPRRRR